MHYRKIGGLHWLAIGRLRIAFCIVKQKQPSLPKAKTLEAILKQIDKDVADHVQRITA